MSESSAYIKEFHKIATELITQATDDPDASFRRGIKAILAIGAGTALGTGLGTGAAYLSRKYVPPEMKEFVFPVVATMGGLGGAALGAYLEKKRQDYIEGPPKERVLIRTEGLSDEEYNKVRRLLHNAVPKVRDKSVYLSRSDDEHYGIDREFRVSSVDEIEGLNKKLWGNK